MQAGRLRHKASPGPPLGGDTIADLMAAFAAELPTRSQFIQEALRDRNLDLLARLTHQLAGTAAIYGFAQVSDAARAIHRRVTEEEALRQIESSVAELANLCEKELGRTTVASAADGDRIDRFYLPPYRSRTASTRPVRRRCLRTTDSSQPARHSRRCLRESTWGGPISRWAWSMTLAARCPGSASPRNRRRGRKTPPRRMGKAVIEAAAASRPGAARPSPGSASARPARWTSPPADWSRR